MPTIEIPASEAGVDAVEQQVIATQFAEGLVLDPQTANLCLTQITRHPSVGDTTVPTDPATHQISLGWCMLASMTLREATPFEWDDDATRLVEAKAAKLSPDAVLTRDALPAKTGWWWWGHPSPISLAQPPCALAWGAGDTGVALYPNLMHVGRWRLDCAFKGQPYELGPLPIGALTVPYGASWVEVARQWDDVPREVQTLGTVSLCFLIAACQALVRGNVIAPKIPVDAAARARLQRDYPEQQVAEAVHVVTLGPQSGQQRHH